MKPGSSARGARFITALLWVSTAACVTGMAQKAAPPAQDASAYAAVDVHANEKVAVAADPLDSKSRASFLQIDYLKAGFLPVRLIVTNNGEVPIKLDQVRVYFVTADGNKLKAVEAEDVERRIRDVKDPNKSMQMPFPLKGLSKSKDKDPKVEADFRLADFASLTVEPHGTQSGFLFFDVSGLDSPLAAAKLLVRGIEFKDGTQLFYFEVPLDKYLAGKPKP